MITSDRHPESLVESCAAEPLFTTVRDLVVEARRTVARGINHLQVRTNFEIGRHIVEYEQHGENRAGYGKELLADLSGRLTAEFGRGFSRTNLAAMRQFYLVFRDYTQEPAATVKSTEFGQAISETIVQTVSGQFDNTHKLLANNDQVITRDAMTRTEFPCLFSLGWSHYIFLLGIRNPEERRFYEIEATNENWTIRELRRQFDSSLYERLALSRDKEGVHRLAREGQIVARAEDLLKEPVVLEFLGLDERARYSEMDLESAIIGKLERFLLELGKGFLFEARQKRFTFDEEHFFVDLVFYNRILRCYVLVDLKIGKLTHQDLGQMQMYVNYFDRHVRLPGENSTVGIILCKKNRETMVEITLPKDANIHAQEYRLYLPGKDELQRKLAEWTAEISDK